MPTVDLAYCLLRRTQRGAFPQKVRQKAAQHLRHGDGGHASGGVRLTRQIAAEFLHQRPAVLLAAVREVKTHHGGIDVTVT